MSLLLDALKAAEGQTQRSQSAEAAQRGEPPADSAAAAVPAVIDAPTEEQILTLAEEVASAPAKPAPAAPPQYRHNPAAFPPMDDTEPMVARRASRSQQWQRWVKPAGLAVLLLAAAAAAWVMFDPAAPMPALAPPVIPAPPVAVEAAATESVAATPVADTPADTGEVAADTPDDYPYELEGNPADYELAVRAPASVAVRAPLVISGRPSPLTAAHAALRAGDLSRAESLYRETLATERDQPDAHLGMALIEQSRGGTAAALVQYRAVLALRPGDPQAWAGLADLTGDGELEGMESRLRNLLATRPDAALHFALGNILARQLRWSDAQESYFAAATGAPQNADYAFNLAVALDRLGKGRVAIPHYARALALAGDARAVQFDASSVRTRMQQLEALP
jgi:tetratricopeptide (TPR) repeat protein